MINEKTLNEKIRECLVLEHDFQTGEIEFSMTGELIPLERLEPLLKEAVEGFMEDIKLKHQIKTQTKKYIYYFIKKRFGEFK